MSFPGFLAEHPVRAPSLRKCYPRGPPVCPTGGNGGVEVTRRLRCMPLRHLGSDIQRTIQVLFHQSWVCTCIVPWHPTFIAVTSSLDRPRSSARIRFASASRPNPSMLGWLAHSKCQAKPSLTISPTGVVDVLVNFQFHPTNRSWPPFRARETRELRRCPSPLKILL